MNTGKPRGDLIFLVADKDIEATVNGLLRRPESLGIRRIHHQVYVHPHRDPGCRGQAHAFLRAFSNQYEHAIVMLDREGSGRESEESTQIERNVEERLSRNGWDDRAATIALDPEVEIWVWSDSNEVDQVMGWTGRIPSLRDWLVEESYVDRASDKPSRPKEAFRGALKHVRKQPSSSLFFKMAERVSVQRCNDRAFLKLKERLACWFPCK